MTGQESCEGLYVPSLANLLFTVFLTKIYGAQVPRPGTRQTRLHTSIAGELCASGELPQFPPHEMGIITVLHQVDV